ncbi:MAG: hypothetical protein E6I93_04265 [Chloroflexi bacterium]|nr:MAG: hypothetical protein E6I93_04265 [Chloroflexota bacterium]
MEEQLIQEFVHRVSTDEKLCEELKNDPDGVIMREGFSPRVAQVVSRLVPHLAFDKPIDPSLNFWH